MCFLACRHVLSAARGRENWFWVSLITARRCQKETLMSNGRNCGLEERVDERRDGRAAQEDQNRQSEEGNQDGNHPVLLVEPQKQEELLHDAGLLLLLGLLKGGLFLVVHRTGLKLPVITVWVIHLLGVLPIGHRAFVECLADGSPAEGAHEQPEAGHQHEKHDGQGQIAHDQAHAASDKIPYHVEWPSDLWQCPQ